MIDLGEAVLAVLGVRPVLSKAVERTTAAQWREIHSIDKTVEDRAAALCRGDYPGKVKIAAVNYETMRRDLVTDPDFGQVVAMVEKFPPHETEAAAAFLVKAGQAVQYLKTKFPIAPTIDLVGLDFLPPSDMAVTKYELAFTVVDSPLAVFDLLDTNALLASQVECLRAVYPTLVEEVIAAITRRAIHEKGRVKSWVPHFAPALATLIGRPEVGPTTRAALDAANATRMPPGASGRRPPTKTSRAAAMATTPARQNEAGHAVTGEDG